MEMKGIISVGIGTLAGTVLTTVVSFGLMSKAKRKVEMELSLREKEMDSLRSEMTSRIAVLDHENNQLREELMMLQGNSQVQSDEFERFKVLSEEVSLEKAKIMEAKRGIVDGVEALKNAMFCQNAITREELVIANYQKVLGIVSRIDKEMEFYRRFKQNGKDFKWLEESAAAVRSKMNESTADLESTMQFLGFEEKEKQMLRWGFIS